LRWRDNYKPNIKSKNSGTAISRSSSFIWKKSCYFISRFWYQT